MSSYNSIRANKIIYLKSQNIKLAKQIQAYMKKHENGIESANIDLINRFTKNLVFCGNNTLYNYGYNRDIQLITYLACGNRLCYICNWQRQKKVRRKYYNWFNANKQLYIYTRGDVRKVITKNQVQKYEKKNYQLSGPVEYDVMHCMLSVPHTDNGFNGNKFYFRDIVERFNYLRKNKEWLQFVYGGQFGVETTKNSNGYHIHIHALLFVRREKQNRNKLHRIILKIWNNYTVNEDSKRKDFSQIEISAIKKGNKLIDDDFIKLLDPCGSTIIHLQNIYAVGNNGEKIYGSEWGSESFINSIMETISYLFKPKIFAIDDFIDVESIIDILPKIHGLKCIYSKFGCLFGDNSLNVKDDSLIEDLQEAAALKNVDVDVDETTGEIMQKHWFVTNPLNTFVSGEKIKLKRNKNIINLNSENSRDAVERLYSYYNFKK